MSEGASPFRKYLLNENTQPPKSRLAGLEVIRGLAALAIVAFHMAALYVPIPAGPIDALIRSLSGAVPIFFALSAFSLLYGYQGKLNGEEALRRFYVRRIFRIFPLFYAILILNIVVDVATGVWVSRSEVLVNFFFLFPFFPGKHESLVWAGWSMGVECAFYAIFPAIALSARSLRLSVTLLVAAALVCLASPVIVANLALSKSYASMSFPSNFVYFQCGVTTFACTKYLASTGNLEKIRLIGASRSTLLLLGSVLLLMLLRFAAVPSFVLLALACCTWIFCAYCGLPSWLDHSVSRFFGRLSYGVYLIHPLVLYYMTKLGIYKQIGTFINGPHLIFFAALALTFPIVILLAYIGYRLIESPGIATGEKWLASIANANQQRTS